MSLPAPYYQDDWVTLYHGDCLEILPEIPDKSIDLVLTDPPYGIGKAGWDNEFPSWLSFEAFRISNVLCVMLAPWCIPQCISQMGDKYFWMLAGHKPAAMTRGRMGINKWLPAIVGGDIKTKPGADAKDFTVNSKEDFQTGHPCQKPIQYVCWLIGLLSEKSQTILDPFLGSGTTAVAAKQLGRRCIGIEIEEKYLEIAVKRLQQDPLPLTPKPEPVPVTDNLWGDP